MAYDDPILKLAPEDFEEPPPRPTPMTVPPPSGAPAPVETGLQKIEAGVADIRGYYQPVACELSPWTVKEATDWAPEPCPSNGQQTRDVIYERTIITPPANGGTPCGPLTYATTEARTCTPPPPPGPDLLYQSSMQLEGSFKVPLELDSVRTLEYGGTALSYWPDHDSLLLAGHDHYQLVAEITIEPPAKDVTLAALPRAKWKQPPTDLFQGKRITATDGGSNNGVKVGGITPVGADLYVNCWTYYDGATPKQKLTHWKSGPDFTNLPPVVGPWQVGRGFQAFDPTDEQRIGGFVGCYMCPIPPEWQSALGGTHLSGMGGGISILNRTSSGPSATVFTPTDGGTPAAISNAHLVLGYPTGGKLNYPTLGIWGQNGGLYTGLEVFRGMIFPDGTRSILFFGRGGTSFCYGGQTKDQTLHLQPCPPPNQTQHYCYDLAMGGTGTHGFPYQSLVFAYDVLDLIKVKEGHLKPWEPRPYATWRFTLPFQNPQAENLICGASWDPVKKRIFLASVRNDDLKPVIHTLTITATPVPTRAAEKPEKKPKG